MKIIIREVLKRFHFVIILIFLVQSLFGQVVKVDSLKALLSASKGDSMHVNILNDLCWELKYSDPLKAKAYAVEADSLAIEIKYTKGEAKALNNIGAIHLLQGEYDSSIVYLKRAYALYQEIGNKKGMAKCLSNIGTNYYYTGNSEKAMTYFLLSLKLSEEIKDKDGIATSYLSVGNVYTQLGEYIKAIENYQDAYAIFIVVKNLTGAAQAINNVGACYRFLENYDQAIFYYKKSIEIREKLDDKYGIAENLLNIGDAYSKLGSYNLAILFFNKSYSEYKELGIKKSMAVSLNDLGYAYFFLRQYDNALIYLNQSLVIAKEIKSLDLMKEAYSSLRDVYYGKADYKSAYDYYKLFSDVKDSILNTEMNNQITEMRTKYETEKKEKENELLTKENQIKDLTVSTQTSKLTKQRTILFSVIALALFIALIGYLFFNRYKLKQRNSRNELARRNLEIEQRLLRAQMNPHFIFNSLNSIQSFISSNKVDNAEIFLAKFAKLMRYILENSRKPYILLEDEMNTLQLYLDLERLRFNNKFDFAINVSSDINPENISVPPMLIQPFIENAILHGIMNKPDKGLINVDFVLHDDDIVSCTIEDNGIGREKAMQLKRKDNVVTHNSLGVQVTRERLDLLLKQSLKEKAIEFTDLKNDKDEACGTRVKLYFPYEINFG